MHLARGVVVVKIIADAAFEENEELLGVVHEEVAGRTRGVFDDEGIHLASDLREGERHVADAVLVAVVASQLLPFIDASEGVGCLGLFAVGKKLAEGEGECLRDTDKGLQGWRLAEVLDLRDEALAEAAAFGQLLDRETLGLADFTYGLGYL